MRRESGIIKLEVSYGNYGSKGGTQLSSGNPGNAFGMFTDETCKTDQIIETLDLEKIDGTPIIHKFEYKINGKKSENEGSDYSKKEVLRIAVYPGFISEA